MNIDILEEIEIEENLTQPFLGHLSDGLAERKKVAINISLRNPEDILLIDKYGFSADLIFAGLTEKQIEYFAKHAPLEYKRELLRIFSNEEAMKGVEEIVMDMDDDEGAGSRKNKDRIRKVMQYIKDNQIIFRG